MSIIEIGALLLVIAMVIFGVIFVSVFTMMIVDPDCFDEMLEKASDDGRTNQ